MTIQGNLRVESRKRVNFHLRSFSSARKLSLVVLSCFSSTFSDLRKDVEFTDVTVVCEDDHQVEAHKVILAASSPLFKNMLQRNMLHSNIEANTCDTCYLVYIKISKSLLHFFFFFLKLKLTLSYTT